MANRYTLSNVYRPEEAGPGDYLRQGIGQALDTYLKEHEARRQEQNDLGAAGARELPKGESVGAATLPTFSMNVPTPDVGQDVAIVPGVSVHLPSTGARSTIRATPPFAEPQYGATGGGPVGIRQMLGAAASLGGPQLGAASAPMPAVPQRTAQMPQAPAPPLSRGQGIGRMIGQAIGAPDESQQPTVTTTPSNLVPYRARNGKTYLIDPNYGARVAFGEKERESEIAQSATDARTQRDQEQKIQSLVAAGMDPDEARARVLNNTVQYDTEFGRQFAPNHSLTFGERQQLEAEQFLHQQELQRLRNAGRVAADRARYALQHGTTGEKRQALQAWEKALNDELRANTSASANDWMNPDSPDIQQHADDRARILDDIQEVEGRLRILGGAPNAARTDGGGSTRQQQPLEPLSPEMRQKAASDPGFAAWLRSKGYRL